MSYGLLLHPRLVATATAYAIATATATAIAIATATATATASQYELLSSFAFMLITSSRCLSPKKVAYTSQNSPALA